MPAAITFPAVQKRKLFEDVAAHIRQLIVTRQLKAGDRLPSERELSTRYGVGRPSVREALRMLSQEGLLEVQAGEGAFVRRPSFPSYLKSMGASLGALIGRDASTLLELWDVRRVLEVETTSMAAERAEREDLERLRRALDDNARDVRSPARFKFSDVRFHRAIAEATHNRILLFFYDALADLMLKTRETALTVRGAAPDALASHARILRAIEGRTAQVAGREMARHLDRVRGRLEQALSRRH